MTSPTWVRHYSLALLMLADLAIATPKPEALLLEEACWEQTFNDEFDHLSLWDSDSDSGLWKTAYIWDRNTIINNELQYYVDPSLHGVSAFSNKNSILTISASRVPENLRSQLKDSEFISGVLTTEKSFSQQYGRFEIRARMPAGRGLWPAFWMLPSFDQWPEGIAVLPEIDVMEFIGSSVNTYHTTVHSNETGNLESYSFEHNELSDLTRDFHVFGVLWDEQNIRWYLDGVQMVSHRTPDDLHRPMHFLVNLAVGGNWAGAPDETTTWPAEYQIDYVRAFRQKEICD